MQPLVLAVDVGGTKTAMSVVDVSRNILSRTQVATCGRADISIFVQGLVDAFEQWLDSLQMTFRNISVISMSLAARCIVTSDHNINFIGDNIPALHVVGGVPLIEMISDQSGIPTIGSTTEWQLRLENKGQ